MLFTCCFQEFIVENSTAVAQIFQRDSLFGATFDAFDLLLGIPDVALHSVMLYGLNVGKSKRGLELEHWIIYIMQATLPRTA